MNMRALIGRAKPIPPVSEHAHHMIIMDHTGDRTMTWNPEDHASVTSARNEFDRLLRDGYTAYRMRVVMENGVVVEEKDDGAIVRTFDPAVGKYMLAPRLQGG